MIPKIVLKLLTIIICICATLFIGYSLWNDSNVVQFLVTQNTNLEYHAARSTVVLGGGVLIVVCILFTALQVWLFLVLLDCFSLIQARLAKESVTVDEIDAVVITHGHPGHIGNMNFFGQKPILFHSMEYVGRRATPTELKDRPYRKLSTNVEVWKTPGHTQHDLSVLVHNVPGYGSMAIVGDLIPSEAFLAEKIDLMAEESVWDSTIKRQNANLVICMADWVIPGHGQPFRVMPQYRQKAGCTRLLAQQRLLNA
uniref:Lactamase_B domain-containing protein n=1 Tax=Ascaris lumbricoides TaxID=6252 RepID=A0A0M3HUG9_ASCLU